MITITRKKDFERLFANGRRFRKKAVEVVCLARDDAGETHIAFIVGKSVDTRAVVRNRIRRRMRHAWRVLAKGMAPGHDVACIAKAPATGARYRELAEELSALLIDATLIDARNLNGKEVPG